jgi:hypothetical protein
MTPMTHIHKNELPPLLSELGGGFYMGLINFDGRPHALIRAPKADGHFAGAWLDADHGKLDGCSSVADGLANTRAMAAAGSELAQQVLALRIGGAEDWHIPARDQLEIMYRNAKPATHENWCSWRDGDNPNSIPPGQLYTEESPAQVANPLFQAGGAEAFDPMWYWSSTQSSALTAYVQDFLNGLQDNGTKGSRARAFAVRMILVVE